MPQPAAEHEAAYESVLVAFTDEAYRPEAMSTAAKLAARRAHGIHVLVTIEVPRNQPVDAPLPERERAAQEIIEQARVQGGRRVTGRFEKVRPGQSGRRIVEVARDLRARAIVLPVERGGGLGRTAETLLRERPCRIIIESLPA